MSLLFLITAFPFLAAVTALRLCHTNDFHARYVEINSANSNCAKTDIASGNCYGGIARLSTAFKALSCDLKIQTGDFVQGTVYDTAFGANIAIAGYRWLGYDIAVFGNHEFNKGPDPIYKTVTSTPTVNWLSSNVNFTKAPPGFNVNTNLDLYGICWASVLTNATTLISNPGSDVQIANETVSMRKAIANCKQQDRVIAVTHQGFETDVRMCSDIKEIDLIIGGHSHTNLDNGKYPVRVERSDGSMCIVVQAFAYGRYIGMLDVEFNDNGVIQLPSHAYVVTDSRVSNDEEVAKKLSLYTELLDSKINDVIGSATDLIDGSRACRERECQMGNMACDSMLAYAAAHGGATLCLTNGGGLRSSIEKGDITMEDVVTVLPFGNVHAMITLPGAGVIDALEHAFTAVDTEDNRGRFPQVGGMAVVGDLSAAPGKRVQSVTIDGTPIQEDKLYVLVTNSFIADGGDGFSWPTSTNIELSGRALYVLMIEYLRANNPYTPILENRIVDSSA